LNKKSISPGFFNFKQDARIAGPDSGYFLLFHPLLQCESERGRGHNLLGIIKISLGVYDFKTAVKFVLMLLPTDFPVVEIRAEL